MAFIHLPQKLYGNVKPSYWPLGPSAVRQNAELIGIDPSSIKAYWPFWEGTNFPVNVMLGEAGELAAYGTTEPTWTTEGIYGDGVADFVKVWNQADLVDLDPSFSVLSRCNFPSPQVDKRLFSVGSSGSEILTIGTGGPAGTLRVFSSASFEGKWQFVTTENTFFDGNYRDICCSFEKNQYCDVFLGGVQTDHVLRSTFSGITDTPYCSWLTVWRGADPNGIAFGEGELSYGLVTSPKLAPEKIELLAHTPYVLAQVPRKTIFIDMAPPVAGAIMTLFQGSNLGADLFNGVLS